MAAAPGPTARASPPEEAVLSVVHELVDRLQPGHRRVPVRIESLLDRDLGLDSLARVELLVRLQRRFDVALPERTAFAAESVRDLLRAIAAARPATGSRPSAPPPIAADVVEDLPHAATSLVEVLTWHAQHHGGRVHVRLLLGEGEPQTLGYADLLEEARRIATGIRARELGPRPAVALMLPTSREFFTSFFGVILAGAVPVPIYPPFRASQLAEHLRRQALILRNAQARLLIATSDSGRFSRLLQIQAPTLAGVATPAELARETPAPIPPVRADDVALVQYTSGSTGDPKGVVLAHANLLANIRAMGAQADVRSTDTFVSWLPLYHDMGLIGAWMGSLYYACPLVVMPPSAFLTRPESWLRAIHEHGGTISAAPNFAYELAASRIDDDRIAGLDLSRWRLAFNGSEPISPGTIERFTRRFERFGFRPSALTPVYGMAECSLGLTFPPAGRGPRIDRVQREPFERDGRALPGSDGALTFVSSGLPLSGHEVRVVDEQGHELPERTQGRVQFRGPSATRGYLRNPAADRALFDRGWLETGDLGYFAFGELFVTGRAKDVIIRAGRHLFPYELEQTVAAVSGVRKGGVAAFAVTDERLATERLVVVAETSERAADRRAELRARIDAAIAGLLGTTAEQEVVLVAPRTLPKTSSGKLRRSACRALYERGDLARARSIRRQMLRVLVGALGPAARRAARWVGERAHAAWFWTAFALLVPVAWVLAIAAPQVRMRRRLAAAVVRTFFRIVRVPIDVTGADRLPLGAGVVVANHSSYLDGLVLAAVLPARYALVAKAELGRNPLLRVGLRRLGVELVERFDPERGAADADRLERALGRGGSLAFFPEGTLRRAPGIFPFHMGAFLLAARSRAAICPVIIEGTRAVLRGDQWFPRRGRIRVAVLPPLLARDDSWESAVSVRDEARSLISRATGEPEVSG